MIDDITIVIPFYSALRFLRPAIESVLEQQDPHWRLLVLDDASPEPGVEALVARYADSRIRYIRHRVNVGMAENWNAGFDLADTPLVTLLHADDALGNGYVGAMRSALTRHPNASMAYCLSRVIDADGRPLKSAKEFVKTALRPRGLQEALVAGRLGFTRLSWANFIMCGTLCYRRERFSGLRFDQANRTLPDFDLVIRAVLRGDMLVGVPRYEHFYRRHEIGSATARHLADLARFREDAELLDRMAVEARRRGWNRAALIARLRPILFFHLAYCTIGDFARGRTKSALMKAGFLGREIRRISRGAYGTAH